MSSREEVWEAIESIKQDITAITTYLNDTHESLEQIKLDLTEVRTDMNWLKKLIVIVLGALVTFGLGIMVKLLFG